MKSQRSSERGATLVAVLLILLIVTILGTLAIRQGLVSLNLSTNSQAKQLLLQSSDSAIFAVENPDMLGQNLLTNGFLKVVTSSGNETKELVFCYSGKNTVFFDYEKASFITWDAGATPTNDSIGKSGYCDNTVVDGFTSGRQAALTQVAVKLGGVSTQPFDSAQDGTDTDTTKTMSTKSISVFSTSLLPALSSADPTKVGNCLKNHMSDVAVPSGVTVGAADADGITADDSVTDCLAKLNVPVSTQVTEYRLLQALN